jgi:putative transposase
MTLATDEFIRRFLIHLLPHGFNRICHYGLFANHNIARVRDLLAVPVLTPAPRAISAIRDLALDFNSRIASRISVPSA